MVNKDGQKSERSRVYSILYIEKIKAKRGRKDKNIYIAWFCFLSLFYLSYWLQRAEKEALNDKD